MRQDFRVGENPLDPVSRPERSSLVDASVNENDDGLDLSLRPRRLNEFIGQDRLRSNLDVFLRAARQREEPVDHILLYGPPGLGKTTLANIVAREMNAEIHVTSGPALSNAGDLVGILTNLPESGVLFIDEVHRLPRALEEYLYPAMEDRKVDITIGKGPAARSIRLDVPPFTVIGATTRQGMLTGPLRDRFGVILHFDLYDEASLYEIVKRSSQILGYEIEESGARELAKRSRGTPRIANRLLRRVRDFAQVYGEDSINLQSVSRACEALEVDADGLDRLDRAVLSALIERYRGGPVGLETLAATVGQDAGTLEEVVEPFLLRAGFIMRTARGRAATDHAYKHMGKPVPARAADAQPTLDDVS